jgi:hypothetical protein
MYFQSYEATKDMYHITVKLPGAEGAGQNYVMPMNSTLYSLRRKVQENTGIPFHQISLKLENSTGNVNINLGREIEEFYSVESIR